MFLDIKNLKIKYYMDGNPVEVVRGLNLSVGKGECVGLVGESGCGKTTVGLALTRLISEEKGFISSGEILLEGEDILKLERDGLRAIRGSKISYVFQEPFSSLNPVFTVYVQLREVFREKKDPDREITEALNAVGLGDIAGNKKIYPHELSGGMQQRVMIAMAIALKPDLLVLDEPTTALDVTVQNRILDLISELKEKLNLSILFISHDLNVVFKLADRIAVMYSGLIVEEGKKEDVFLRKAHPYTRGLMNSIPSIEHRNKKFDAIEGGMPLFWDLPGGCKFHPRCRYRIDACTAKEPLKEKVLPGHFTRCIRSKEILSHGTGEGK